MMAPIDAVEQNLNSHFYTCRLGPMTYNDIYGEIALQLPAYTPKHILQLLKSNQLHRSHTYYFLAIYEKSHNIGYPYLDWNQIVQQYFPQARSNFSFTIRDVLTTLAQYIPDKHSPPPARIIYTIIQLYP